MEATPILTPAPAPRTFAVGDKVTFTDSTFSFRKVSFKVRAGKIVELGRTKALVKYGRYTAWVSLSELRHVNERNALTEAWEEARKNLTSPTPA